MNPEPPSSCWYMSRPSPTTHSSKSCFEYWQVTRHEPPLKILGCYHRVYWERYNTPKVSKITVIRFVQLKWTRKLNCFTRNFIFIKYQFDLCLFCVDYCFSFWSELSFFISVLLFWEFGVVTHELHQVPEKILVEYFTSASAVRVCCFISVLIFCLASE